MASISTEERVPTTVDADVDPSAEKVQVAMRSVLVELGEDPTREGLAQTPLRVDKALRFLTSGYEQDIDAVINNALFTVDYS